MKHRLPLQKKCIQGDTAHGITSFNHRVVTQVADKLVYQARPISLAYWELGHREKREGLADVISNL